MSEVVSRQLMPAVMNQSTTGELGRIHWVESVAGNNTGGIGTATRIPAEFTTIFGTTASGESVLPEGLTGRSKHIFNSSAVAKVIFAASGENIDNLASISMAAREARTLICYSPGAWRTINIFTVP